MVGVWVRRWFGAAREGSQAPRRRVGRGRFIGVRGNQSIMPGTAIAPSREGAMKQQNTLAPARGMTIPANLATMLLLSPPAAADHIKCPAVFSPPRPEVTPAPGWQAIWSGDPAEKLGGVEITYDTHDKLTFLAPSTRWNGRRIVQTWTCAPAGMTPCRSGSTASTRTRHSVWPVQSCTLTATDDGDHSLGFPITVECN